MLFEQRQFQFSQITYSLYPKLRQLVSCNFADSRQASDRKRQQKRIDILGLDDKEPIWFAPIRSEFCQKFVWRYARRGGQTQFLADLVTNCAGHQGSSRQARLVLCDIEIRFVERQWLDEISVSFEDLAHTARDGPVPCKIRRDEYCLRTQAFGTHCRHR